MTSIERTLLQQRLAIANQRVRSAFDQRRMSRRFVTRRRTRIRFGYDRNSNRPFRANLTAQALGKPFDERYAYDRVNRLIDFQRGTLNAQNNAISGTPTKAQTWGLDATGNWPQFTSATGGVTEVDQTRTHNQVNEITSLSAWAPTAYDAAGNMTRMPKPAEPTEGFAAAYDAWNRLTKIREVDECGCPADTVAEYAYNGLNWRVKKVVPIAGGSESRRFYFSASWQTLEERVNGASFPERQYIWGLRYIDDLILRDRDTDGDGSLDERLFPTQDANWNVTSLIDTSGATQERYAYEAYGTPAFLDATYGPLTESQFEWETLFASYRRDVETGLYVIRWRLLHSLLGRWITRDFFGLLVSPNFYRYAASNPMSTTDAFGLACDWEEHAIIAFAIPLFEKYGKKLVKKAVVKGTARAAVAAAADGPVPIGDLIGLISFAYTGGQILGIWLFAGPAVENIVREFQNKLVTIANRWSETMKEYVGDKFKDVFDCLDQKPICCREFKELITKLSDQFLHLVGTSKKEKKQALVEIQKVLSREGDDVFRCCCGITKGPRKKQAQGLEKALEQEDSIREYKGRGGQADTLGKSEQGVKEALRREQDTE